MKKYLLALGLVLSCAFMLSAQEAPDTNSVTTVKEYKYVLKETLPPVRGTSNYKWDDKEKVVVFPINVWSGWLPIIAANHGFAPNTESIFYKKYGFKVNLKLIDDPVMARDSYASGESHVLWCTVDILSLFAGELMKDSRTAPRVFQQIDWSSGGDGIVTRNRIRSAKDLKGKTIVYAQNSPSQYFVSTLLINAGIGLDEVTHKYTSTAFEAAAAFVSDKNIDACVSWAPDIYTIPEKVAGTRILTTTEDANKLIADVWAARADFAKDHPDIIEGLVAGIFEGMDLLANPTTKAKAFQWMADGYGMSLEEAMSMEADSHSTNFAENEQFFLNANSATNFEQTWKSVSSVYREAGLIGEIVPFQQIMDFSVIKKLKEKGTFSHHKDTYVSTFAPSTYSKIMAEAPIITQTVRINFYPNSSNLYEPRHDLRGKPIANTLYDQNIESTLERVARLSGSYDRAVISIVGHADSSMKGRVNEKVVLDLSKKRAEAVKQALVIKYSFPPNKFVVEGKGWREPADELDSGNHALNRRVEISVYSPESE
jgi:NitT/TauT family transport system substrate-binding protein